MLRSGCKVLPERIAQICRFLNTPLLTTVWLCLRLPSRQNHRMAYKRIILGMSTIAVLIVAINLALHFGQKAHDQLDYNIDQAFPAGQPFVPGEIYASTLAAIMDHELRGGFGWRPNDFFFWGPHVTA